MEKRKLKLDDLKVQSFVTELQPEIAHTAKGGDDVSAVTCPVISTAAGCLQTICILSRKCTNGTTPAPTTKPSTQPTTEV